MKERWSPPSGGRESETHPFEPAAEILEAEMPSRLAERERMIEAVLAALAAADCSPDPFFDRLAIDELLANAILHGNRSDAAKRVTVRVFCTAERWGVEIADEGAGFDWKRVLERAGKDADPSSPSGRGIALLVASGADVRFLDGGRRVVFLRRR
jgi:anti-sigma regulatory factor (Ser/Thr protein kinase)